MAKVSPGEFVRQVRQETSKVTWPTRQETITSVLMVFVMVIVVALFFFVVDLGLSAIVQFVLSLGG